jgi:hypothetical protein
LRDNAFARVNGQANNYGKFIFHFLDSDHRQFMHSVPLPAGVDKATIKCDMENGRRLCIWAQSKSAAAEPREIPINVKQTVKKEAQIKVEVHFEIHH